MDLGDFNNQLNETDSNPNEIIDEVNNDINDEEQELSAGDIIALIDLVGNAVAVWFILQLESVLSQYLG